MNYKYHIDTKVYRIKPYENYIHMTGWCFNVNDKEVNYFVKMNGELVESEITFIKRPDVEKKFTKKYNVAIKSGFSIKAFWPKDKEELDKIELFVKRE